MKQAVLVIFMGIILSILITAMAEDEKPAPKSELKTDAAKFSYAFGMEVGTYLKNLKSEIDLPVFIQGIEDIIQGKETLLTSEQAEQIKKEFFMKQQAEMAEKNRKEGESFLAENKKKPGVLTTASGLQYTVLQEGKGPQPKSSDQVKVHYRGTLINGTEFDSSYKRGEPIVFPVTGVIRGWVEALQMMKVGSKYKLFIPSNLAYGERGAGELIGPNATLIFEVELLEIVK